MNFESLVRAKFTELIDTQDPKLLALLVERATCHENLENLFTDVDVETAMGLLAEVSLRDLLVLKSANPDLQKAWLSFMPPADFLSSA